MRSDLSKQANAITGVGQKTEADEPIGERHAVTQEDRERDSGEFKEVLPPHLQTTALDDLAESERRYRRLFEAARDGILLLDVNTGHITDANPFMTEMLGYSHAELLGKELWEIGLFADKEASVIAFRQLQETGYLRYEDRPLQTKGGERREVEFVSNVYRENGHFVIQCNIRDITARRHVERELQAALVRELRITEALQYPLTMDIAEDALPGLLVAGCYEPALKEAEVGGDFYDAFSFHSHKKTDEDTALVALAVGDVTGKGVLAAALAGRVKNVLRAFLRENADPAETLVRLNDYLCDAVSSTGYSDKLSARMTILTLSLAIINPRTGVATISSAGAEPPALLRTTGAVEVITERGLLLGVQPNVRYESRRISLHPGDTLLMVTDGITEARNLTHTAEGATSSGPNLLGYEGMLTIARQNQAASSLRAMSQGILEDARAFGGSFRDDVCLLLARRREPEPTPTKSDATTTASEALLPVPPHQ